MNEIDLPATIPPAMHEALVVVTGKGRNERDMLQYGKKYDLRDNPCIDKFTLDDVIKETGRRATNGAVLREIRKKRYEGVMRVVQGEWESKENPFKYFKNKV
jgi:hypothetical protein